MSQLDVVLENIEGLEETMKSLENKEFDYGSLVLNTGTKIELKEDTPLYARYFSKKNERYKKGIFYIYSDKIVNDRIRICVDPDYAEKPGSSLGWINIYDIIYNGKMNIGDKVRVYGRLTLYAVGIGDNPSDYETGYVANETIMYVTDVLPTIDYTNNIGFALEKGKERVGFGSRTMITKYYKIKEGLNDND